MKLMIVIGVSTAYLLGTLITWRSLALTRIIPCVVILFGLFFIPESPRWLAKTGKHREFEAALRKLRGEDADVSREEAEIQARLSGNGGTTAYALIQIPITLVGAILMDKSGRRPLLMVSATGEFVGCFLTGISFFLKIFVASFSIGMGAIPWVIMPEVLRACAQFRNFKVGIQVHTYVVTYGAELNLQVCNSLSDVYSTCKDFESARRVFSQMAERDLLSWNSLISGYGCNGFLQLALELLGTMRLEGFEPDFVTWKIAVDVYCRMGQCDEAWKIFEQIEEANISSWTTLISVYSRIGKA
ncbi:hypothetical protein RHSIM_Rhsim08G0247400 [Rhododendron simsii]|uniref:Uncharacterized protein n=1 Tax=Rhododendron simsii TaxID=118357 RepID=A0A834GJY0_RHOSS|nr:hypothetical protein RHSIM_Rhsim08G0247400 [Rhododendron simsii]